MSLSFHPHYLTLVDQIERCLPVAEWKSADVEIWPLARMDLYLDMYWQTVGSPVAGRLSRKLRALEHLSRPVTNLWKRRHDWRHHLLRPRPADAIFLGDGVSLDRVDGAWEDRYGEPLMEALAAQGIDSFLMQPGDLRRVPWRRPTFAANGAAAAGHALAPLFRAPVALPGHAALAQLLHRAGVHAPSLSPERLAQRAATLRATSHVFGRILRAVKPRLAFTVTWYAGLGPAFLDACRRQGILSIDLQHCPQGGRHKAYRWHAMPAEGYRVLPAIFWTWSEEDAAEIAAWTSGPWHRGLHGGHPRLAECLDDTDLRTRHWDALFREASGGAVAEREILIALQTVGGDGEISNALADRIAASPPSWRWWIRRHPAARPDEDALYARLLALRGPNIRIEEASAFPLPVLLRHMTLVLSVASGVAVEAGFFGIPVIFLSGSANGPFGYLTESGHATIVDDLDGLEAAIAALPRRSSRPPARHWPALSLTLDQLNRMAVEYGRLCIDT